MAHLIALTLAGIMLGQAPSPALRIVVLEGENAVNIIQQKTAVRPLVEVRDRNNVPVSGATVTFTVGSGQPAAFAGGAQTLTVTTNASGQAAASGFNVAGAGKIQVQVQAAFQGQVASATITQTAFATAAAAGAAAATVAAGAGAGGGGLSATTIAIVGGAVGGGAVVATQTGILGGGDEGSNDGNDGNGNGGESLTTYRGTFSGPFTFTSVGTGGPISPSTCVFQRSMTGTFEIDLRSDNSGGRAYVEGSQTDQSVSGTQGCTLLASPVTFTTPDTVATGGPSALTFSSTRGEVTQRTTVTFSGSHSGSTITGSLTISITTQTTSTSPAGVTNLNGSGTTTLSVTLQR
jgi:hypothetical protein